MYRLALPSDCQPQERLRVNSQFWLAVALSILAHFLFYLAFKQDEQAASLPQQAGQRIEISLSTLPKSKSGASRPAQDLSDAKPVQIPYRKPFGKITPPKPVELPRMKPLEKFVEPKPPKPKLIAEPKPKPKPQPLPKPEPLPLPIPEPKPEPSPEPTPKPEPEPPPEPAPVPEPRPEPLPKAEPVPQPSKPAPEAEEAVPEFKDDFQQLSKTYKPGSPDSRSKEPSPSKSMQPDNGVRPGSILNINPAVVYPLSAQRKGMTGTVVVLIHISVDGHTDGVDLLQSSGFEELDNQVLGAVQHWRFNPPRRGMMPVEGTLKHTVIFGANEEVYDDFRNHWREVKLMPAN